MGRAKLRVEVADVKQCKNTTGFPQIRGGEALVLAFKGPQRCLTKVVTGGFYINYRGAQSP